MRAPLISFIVLLLSLDVQSEDIDCVHIKVHHNTVYRVSPGSPLRINCIVEFCNNTPPVMSWWYSKESTIIPNSTHIYTKWEQETNSRGVFYLHFDNISTSDSGLYRCQGGGSVSHLVSLVAIVSDTEVNTEVNTVTLRNNTSSTSEESESRVNSEFVDIMRQYVYPSAGIVGFVIIVIIVSVLSMRGCKGKQMKKEQTENQYLYTPMSHQPPVQIRRIQPHPRQSLTPHESLPSRDPACTYDNALLRRPSQQQTSMEMATLHSTTASGRDHDDHIYTNMKQADQGEETGGNDEEESSLLYVALNHQITGAHVRPPRPTEETSVYAAIRVG